MRLRWLAVVVLGVAGCEVMRAPVPESSPLAPRADRVATASSDGLPSPGSPAEDDPLTLAAKCLEQGDQVAACAHLETYVRKHPEQVMFRAHLAELLLKLDRLPDAKTHFERFVADAQDATGGPQRHLVHCHTRLMEIGRRSDDPLAEAFHRGVGLLLLVRQQDADPVNRDDGFREEILCKSLKALTEAKERRPTDPRVNLYLAEVYDRMDNRRGADSARAAARNRVVPGTLTPSEQRRLALGSAEK